MTSAFGSWFDEAVDWAGRTWDGFSEFVGAVFDAGLEMAGTFLVLLLLITLTPALAHLALMLVLGARLWFVVAFLFSH